MFTFVQQQHMTEPNRVFAKPWHFRFSKLQIMTQMSPQRWPPSTGFVPSFYNLATNQFPFLRLTQALTSINQEIKRHFLIWKMRLKPLPVQVFWWPAIQSKFHLLPWIWEFWGIFKRLWRKKRDSEKHRSFMQYHIKADNETRSFNANAAKNPNEKWHQSTSEKKCIRYWWIFVDIIIKRNFKTDGDMGGLWNSLTVVRMPKLSINQRDADIYHISMCWSASFRKPQFVTHRWGKVVRFEILDKDRIIYIPSNAWLALLFLISI